MESRWRQKTFKLYDPKADAPFGLSRTKIDFSLECPKCFYLDRRFGIGRPDMPAFTLNKAVDTLLKKEFDIYRAKGEAHPLMKKYGVDAIPFAHTDMEKWRENFVGVQYHHKPTNFMVFGAVDDVWINKKGELIVVDYKATSTTKEISLEDEYKQGYKRQMEVYQWLLRRNGFGVSDTGYFVYVNGRDDRAAFDAKLEFDVQLIAYTGSDAWVEKAVIGAHKILNMTKIPETGARCEYCPYVAARNRTEK